MEAGTGSGASRFLFPLSISGDISGWCRWIAGRARGSWTRVLAEVASQRW